MHWIAHRGNLYGRLPDQENRPEYILAAIDKGYDVEVDVWWTPEEGFQLGHDAPQYQVSLEFLQEHKEKLWIHAKNASALTKLLTLCDGLHVFSHDTDPVVLTSKAMPWAYPGQPIDEHTVCVMPERARGAYTLQQLRTCRGICSDYIGWYKQRHEASVRYGMIIGGRWNCHQENVLRQVCEYLHRHPQSWMDIHIVVNDEPNARTTYLEDTGMDAPLIATFECIPFDIPPHYYDHPKKRWETNAKTAVSMHFMNMKAYEYLAAYDQYDVVIKYRPDIVAKTLPDLENCVPICRQKPDVVLMPGIHVYCGANDQIAVGSPVAMREYCSVYPDIDHHLQHTHGYILHPESMLRFHLDTRNIPIVYFEYTYDLDSRRKPL